MMRTDWTQILIFYLHLELCVWNFGQDWIRTSWVTLNLGWFPFKLYLSKNIATSVSCSTSSYVYALLSIRQHFISIARKGRYQQSLENNFVWILWTQAYILYVKVMNNYCRWNYEKSILLSVFFFHFSNVRTPLILPPRTIDACCSIFLEIF